MAGCRLPSVDWEERQLLFIGELESNNTLNVGWPWGTAESHPTSAVQPFSAHYVTDELLSGQYQSNIFCSTRLVLYSLISGRKHVETFSNIGFSSLERTVKFYFKTSTGTKNL